MAEYEGAGADVDDIARASRGSGADVGDVGIVGARRSGTDVDVDVGNIAGARGLGADVDAVARPAGVGTGVDDVLVA